MCVFCQIVLPEGHFWNFEMMGNRQSQKKILKNCRKNHVLRIYILKYVLRWKMDVIFVIKVWWAFLRKLTNRTQVWPFTLSHNSSHPIAIFSLNPVGSRAFRSKGHTKTIVPFCNSNPLHSFAFSMTPFYFSYHSIFCV